MRQFDIVENANPGTSQHVPYLLILRAPLFDAVSENRLEIIAALDFLFTGS